jgi:CHAD domain-containing protein
VATRQSRAAFRAFKTLLPENQSQFFNKEFAWLASVLGDVRDLDVYLDDYQHYIADFPPEDANELAHYEAYLFDKCREARSTLRECLTSPRYERLTKEYEQYLRLGAETAVAPPENSPSIEAEALRLITKNRQRVLRGGRVITRESPDALLHRLRIRCKRLRYLYELFRPAFDKRLNSEIKWLKKLQNVLGEFQDACVATTRLREYAESVPTLRNKNTNNHLIALGQLIHSQRIKAEERRAEFRSVWPRFDRKGRMKKVISILGKSRG